MHPSPLVQQPTRCRGLHRQLTARVKAEGGGLFGGLKNPFSGNQSAQQQKQQQGPPQQQTTRQPVFPPYQVLEKGSVYDLRFYEVYPVVETSYTRREEGYLVLGTYQDGANTTGSRFAYTQPVVMSYYPDGRKVMQMMVATSTRQQAEGSRKIDSITSLPAPTDPAVRLGVAGGEVVAIMPFEGYITPDTAEAIRQKLMAALQADGLSLAAEEAGGFFRVAQYGQVYTLETRLNELMLRVQL